MIQISEVKEFNSILAKNLGKLIVICFYAEWNEHSKAYKAQFEKIISCLSYSKEDVIFLCCEADALSSISKMMEVNLVPMIVFTDSSKLIIKKEENVPPAVLVEEIENRIYAFKVNFALTKDKMFS